LTYAQTNKLPFATIKNQAGNFVDPSPKSVTAAANGALKTMPEDFRVSITDSAAKDAYPISSFTYLLIYKKMPAEKAKPLQEFLMWAMNQGQKMAEPLFYAPLPKSMVPKVIAKIKTMD
jgi:phosphate transport system substrate-binding protein